MKHTNLENKINALITKFYMDAIEIYAESKLLNAFDRICIAEETKKSFKIIDTMLARLRRHNRINIGFFSRCIMRD